MLTISVAVAVTFVGWVISKEPLGGASLVLGTWSGCFVFFEGTDYVAARISCTYGDPCTGWLLVSMLIAAIATGVLIFLAAIHFARGRS